MSPKPATPRNRILVACTTCQSRRVKCVRKLGDPRCEQCHRSGMDCVIRPDGRRRPISRAEVDSLRSRLQSLESLLRSHNIENSSSSASNHSTVSQGQPSSACNDSEMSFFSGTLPKALPDSPKINSTIVASPKDFPNTGPINTTEYHENGSDLQFGDFVKDSLIATQNLTPINSATRNLNSPHHESSAQPPLADMMSEGPSKMLIDHLIHPNHAVQYDQSSGRMRLSCPIIALHQFSEISQGTTTTSSREQMRSVERVLRELGPETHDHLMESFWSYYDPVMQVVDRDIFEEDRKAGGGLSYSGLLHICILAMGYRYANPKRTDIQKISLPNKESTLHREAKYLVEFEFEKPGGIPSVQALLLLGQLESGSGRDSVGWTYAGIAFRFAIDIGLNLDCSTLNLSKREREFRSYVLRACTAFDRLWAIYLGRSTYIKSSEISRQAFPNKSQQLQNNASQAVASSIKSMENLSFDALLDLLDLSAKVVELLYSRPGPLQHSDHFIVAGLDTDLKEWHSRLPERLVWTQSNIDTAPIPFFHLHSQYHSSLVLLHRPFALYEQSKLGNDSGGDTLMNSLSGVSRAICIEHTFKMVRILTRQFQRFDPTRSPQTQLQHIGTAVAALVSAAAVSVDSQERLKLLESLHVFADLARAIAPTYATGEMISEVLETLLKQPGWEWNRNTAMKHGISANSSQNPLSDNDEFFSQNDLSTASQEIDSSLPRLPDDFNLNFDADDPMDTFPLFGEGNFHPRTPGALIPVSTGLTPIPSQQTEAHKELAQLSYAPLASWTYAALDANYGLGDSFDSGQYKMPDEQFDSML